MGQILAKLDELGLRQDTLVIFSGDNGMNMGHHGIWGKGNGTFPLNMYDTSVKVPFIVSFPQPHPPGGDSPSPAQPLRLPATLLDYLGYPLPEAGLPGKSFASLLRGEAFEPNEHLVVFDEYGPVRMIRSQDWKYVHRYPYGPHELYDLRNDPGETRNLIQEPAQRVYRRRN